MFAARRSLGYPTGIILRQIQLRGIHLMIAPKSNSRQLTSAALSIGNGVRIDRQSTTTNSTINQQSRWLARTSEMAPDSPALKAKNFIMQVGYDDPKVAEGVIEALQQSGVTGTALLSTVRSMAGRWEVGEDAGLEALVEAVKLQLVRKEGRTPITIYCIPANAWKSSEEDQDDFSPIEETPQNFQDAFSRAFKVEAMTGLTLTDVAKFGDGDGASELGDCLECACAGIMACSTCHVVIDPQWFDKVGEACEDEQDMLDLAYAPRSTSRLGCQILLDENMDGMIIRLPRGSNNLMDDIPFEG
ncbi:Adrenodoxin-like protein [Seminavis robusta]|uniref:Adrenodoxin-like protein n=1 Tax=Seminavis robusta TaxID=568900 RepID=A0A9N8DI95_9STRA|nr:Adrenodoxin-like protein [Seminavis robusta]|eukprot:Sro172_g076130.1 Adrenodoxin-like protein (302) ;mRNA; r:99361-100266